MAFLSSDKIPLLMIGAGLIISGTLPGGPTLLSPKFLCIYFFALLAVGFYTWLAVSNGEKSRIILACVISALSLVLLPLIKMHFSR